MASLPERTHMKLLWLRSRARMQPERRGNPPDIFWLLLPCRTVDAGRQKLRDQIEIVGQDLDTIEAASIAFRAARPKSATVTRISSFVRGRGVTVGFLPVGVTEI